MAETKINDCFKKKTNGRAIYQLVPLKKIDKPLQKNNPSVRPFRAVDLSSIIDHYYLNNQTFGRQRIELILTSIGSVVDFLPHIIWKIIFDLQPNIIINPNKFKNKPICKKKDDEIDVVNDFYHKNNYDEYDEYDEWKKYHSIQDFDD